MIIIIIIINYYDNFVISYPGRPSAEESSSDRRIADRGRCLDIPGTAYGGSLDRAGLGRDRKGSCDH